MTEPTAPELLQAQLDTLGISQIDAARRLGYSPSQLHRIVSGQVLIKVEVAVRLEQILGVDGLKLLHCQLDELYAETAAALADSAVVPRHVTSPKELVQRNALIVQDHAAGMTPTEIARKYHLSASWAGSLLRQLGARDNKGPSGIKLKLDEDAIFRDSENGASQRELSAAYGASQTTINRIIHRKRAEARPAEEP